MTTGGRFSDGFLGGAVNGTICGLTGGAGAKIKSVGQFFGGAIGTAVTETLGGERKPLEIAVDAFCAGFAQAGYSSTVGKVFGDNKVVNPRTIDDHIINSTINYFDDIWQYCLGTTAAILSNGLYHESSSKKQNEVEKK